MNVSIVVSAEAKQSVEVTLAGTRTIALLAKQLRWCVLLKGFREAANILREYLVHFYRFGQETQTGATRLQGLLYAV